MKHFKSLMSILLVFCLLLTGCANISTESMSRNVGKNFSLKQTCFAVERGTQLSTNPSTYVLGSGKVLEDLMFDFSQVNMEENGIYTATVSDGSEVFSFLVDVKDDVNDYNVEVMAEVVDAEYNNVQDIVISSPIDGQLTLTWNKVNSADGYEIFQGSSLNGRFVQIKKITNNDNTSTTFGYLIPSRNYYFKVRSYKMVNGEKQIGDFSKVIYQVASPSGNVTIVPTPMPTVEPTQSPTIEPTVEPTVIPTIAPTIEPTKEPTIVPTPTEKPTVVPTVIPTTEPTKVPTPTPTVEPTIIPTTKPTITPTVEPTIVPTIVPTIKPTVEPTVVPTNPPTTVPTQAPTIVPTKVPTIVPTPTSTPTIAPTPTVVPTIVPTVEPTPTPTIVPTIEPTKVPTQAPTIVPTPQPTVVVTPTIVPTSPPTDSDLGNDVNTGNKVDSSVYNLRFSEITGTSITIMWDSLDEDIDGYLIYSSIDGKEFNQIQTVNKSTNSIKFSFLTKKNYAFKVSGYNIRNGIRTVFDASNAISHDYRASSGNEVTPTIVPTAIPTQQPTVIPTVVPTQQPTIAPTIAPTTPTPTVAPTIVPTKVPTIVPTPTSTPTIAPTIVPTPTVKPTETPTEIIKPDNTVSGITRDLFDLTNAERTKLGINTLETDATLSNIAMSRARDMVDRNYFSHYYNGQTQLVLERDTFGYPRTKAIGENIGSIQYSQNVAVDIFNALSNSKGHYANLTNTRWDTMGIGVAQRDDGTWIIVQVFGE